LARCVAAPPLAMFCLGCVGTCADDAFGWLRLEIDITIAGFTGDECGRERPTSPAPVEPEEYDPRLTRYVTEVSLAEATARSKAMLEDQARKLESHIMNRRQTSSDDSADVAAHYAAMIEEMRSEARALETGLFAEAWAPAAGDRSTLRPHIDAWGTMSDPGSPAAMAAEDPLSPGYAFFRDPMMSPSWGGHRPRRKRADAWELDRLARAASRQATVHLDDAMAHTLSEPWYGEVSPEEDEATTMSAASSASSGGIEAHMVCVKSAPCGPCIGKPGRFGMRTSDEDPPGLQHAGTADALAEIDLGPDVQPVLPGTPCGHGDDSTPRRTSLREFVEGHHCRMDDLGEQPRLERAAPLRPRFPTPPDDGSARDAWGEEDDRTADCAYMRMSSEASTAMPRGSLSGASEDTACTEGSPEGTHEHTPLDAPADDECRGGDSTYKLLFGSFSRLPRDRRRDDSPKCSRVLVLAPI